MQLPALFVPLADIREPGQIPALILHVLRVQADANMDLREQVIQVLGRHGTPLLILDNAEHLQEAVASLALHLLEVLPDLPILVTSRQRMNIIGEVLLPLCSLESPDAGLPYDALVEVPAAALFQDRARRVRPDFTLADRNASDFAQICRQLEGSPLALELAAARVTQQTLKQIAADLANNLLILKSRQRGPSKRHQSLRATLQGSAELLSHDQMQLFVSLSIFQGGWTAAAAQAVTRSMETEEFIDDLIFRSMAVRMEQDNCELMRFRLLEPIRQYGAGLLTEAERKHLTVRHANYFLAVAAEVHEDYIGTLRRLDGEVSNLLIALETGSQYDLDQFHSGLIGALYYAYIRSHIRSFLSWVQRAATVLPMICDIEQRVRVGIALYLILGYIGKRDEVHNIGTEMQRDAIEHGYPAGSAIAKLILCHSAFQDAQGYAHLKMAQQTSIEYGMQVITVFCLLKESQVAIAKGYPEYAAIIYGAFLALRERTDLAWKSSDRRDDEIAGALNICLGADKCRELSKRGAQMSLDNVVAMSFVAPIA